MMKKIVVVIIVITIVLVIAIIIHMCLYVSLPLSEHPLHAIAVPVWWIPGRWHRSGGGRLAGYHDIGGTASVPIVAASAFQHSRLHHIQHLRIHNRLPLSAI